MIINDEDYFHIYVNKGYQYYIIIVKNIIENLKMSVMPVLKGVIKRISSKIGGIVIKGIIYFKTYIDSYASIVYICVISKSNHRYCSKIVN